MNENELKKELTREMTSGDHCHSRILHYMPLLEKENCNYIIESHTYDFPTAFVNTVNDWCNERNKDISEHYNFYEKVENARNELLNFRATVSTLCNDYNESHYQDIIYYCIMVQSISLKNYKDILKLCTYAEPLSSKLVSRANNFKKKFNKTYNGRIPINSFYEHELKIQNEQLNIMESRLKKFSISQFPIFILCYDLKRFSNQAKTIHL